MSSYAIQMIEDEHRSLAAVLHAMVYLAHEIRGRHEPPNFELFGAMIYYIDTFPERYHHPKESEYLFPVVEDRCPDAAPLIARLNREHAVGAERIRNLEQALARYQHGGQAELAQFLAAVESYVDFQWKHMAAEERDLLPLAKQHLTREDWQAIDAAFAGHADPLLGASAGTRYEDLFRRIVNLAPAPIGLGPERAARESPRPMKQ